MPPSLKSYIDEEDVLQETLATAWKKIPPDGFEGDGEFDAWLTTIAKSRLVDAIRAAMRQKRGGGRPSILASQRSSWASSCQFDPTARTRTPSSVAVRSENRRQVLSAIRFLPAHYQQVIQLRYLESLPVPEIAEGMNRTEQSVHMLLYRAVRALRQHFRESDL